MKRAFGSAFIDVRAQSCLFGLDQVGSLMSSWDTVRHWCNQRAFLGEVKGVYFLRADVALLSEGLHQWPRDITGPLVLSLEDVLPEVGSELRQRHHLLRSKYPLPLLSGSFVPGERGPHAHKPLALAVALSSLDRSCVARIQLDALGEHIQDS